MGKLIIAPELWKRIIIDGTKTPFLISELGRVYNDELDMLVPTIPDRKGYHFIFIKVKKKLYRLRAHRIVIEYFGNPPSDPNKTQVNHIDGVKSHNWISNLEWTTPKENVAHAFDTGLHSIYTCEKSSHHIHTDEEIHAVCKFMVENPKVSLKKISKLFNIGFATLQNLRLHRSWKEISSQYTFDLIHNTNRSKEFRAKIDELLLSGLSISEVLERLNLPSDITQKEAYMMVYYRKTRLKI
jgi:hypothetical protein